MGRLGSAKIGVFVALAGLLAPRFTRAESAGDIVAKVKAGGFTCTGISGGTFCVSQDKKVNILVPSTDSPIQSAVMYAHGNRGVCKTPGFSGENFLKDQMKPLGEHCAMAVIPDRPNPQDEGFALDKYTQELDKLLGGKLNLMVGGHSSGGKAIADALASFCSRQPGRVLDVGWFDAGYNTADAEKLKQGLKGCKFKVKAVASSTLGTTQTQAATVNAGPDGRVMDVTPVSDDHCAIPKQHFAKMLGNNSCKPPKQDKPVARREPPQPDPGYAQPPPPGAAPPPASYPVAAEPPPSPAYPPTYAEGAQYPTPLAAPALPVGSASSPAARASPFRVPPAGKVTVVAPGKKEQTQDISTITRNGETFLPSGEGGQHESAVYPTAEPKARGQSASGASRGQGSLGRGGAQGAGGEGNASSASSPALAAGASGSAKAGGKNDGGRSEAEGVNQGGGVRNFGARAPSSVLKQFAPSATLGAPAIQMAEEGKNLYDEIDRIQEEEFRPADAAAEDDSLFARAHRTHVRQLERGNVQGGSL